MRWELLSRFQLLNLAVTGEQSAFEQTDDSCGVIADLVHTWFRRLEPFGVFRFLCTALTITLQVRIL